MRQRQVVSNSCFQSSEGSAANFADAPALPSPGTFALPRAHGNAKIYLDFLCPFGFIVVEGDSKPMTNGRCRKRTKKQKPETRNSQLETYERMCNRREDFRLQTSDFGWTARALHAAAVWRARCCLARPGVGSHDSGKRHSCRFCIGASL